MTDLRVKSTGTTRSQVMRSRGSSRSTWRAMQPMLSENVEFLTRMQHLSDVHNLAYFIESTVSVNHR